MSSYVNQGGAINRILEVECGEKVYENPQRTAETVKKNYGIAGKRFVEIVKELGTERIREIQNEFQKKLFNMDKMQKQSISLSIVLTADKIATDYIFKDEQYISIDDARKVLITEYISERMQERQKRTEITQDRVLQELASIAFAKATDYVEIRYNGVNSNVVIKPTAELSEEQIGAIAGIKEGANGIEIKLNDKEKALEMLGRHLGMWNDKLDMKVTPASDTVREMEEYFGNYKTTGNNTADGNTV